MIKNCLIQSGPPCIMANILVNALISHRNNNREGKRPLVIPRRRWVDNIKMDLLEIGWGVVDWIGTTQHQVYQI
jgi:hypothetical protein